MADPLLELLDEARADERRSARGTERSLRRQVEEDARLAGTLLDLVEQATPLTVRTVAGRTHHGVAVGVGGDFVALSCSKGTSALVRLDAITTVLPHPLERHTAAGGHRSSPLEILLLEVLGAADRLRMSLVLRGGEVVTGEVGAVGVDVVSVVLDGDRRSPCYISAASICEALVLRSG